MMRYRPIKSEPENPRLGRYIPDDMEHIEKHPLRIPFMTTTVNRALPLPLWHWTHHQGREGSCVGHGTAMERAIMNELQRRAALTKPYTRRYDPIHIWNAAKARDEWADTNPGDDNGTSVRAAYDVLRTDGARLISTKGIHTPPDSGVPIVTDSRFKPDPAEGISANQWARTVDEMRTAIALGRPVVIGINWYSNYDNPVGRKGNFGRTEYWIGLGELGRIRGGHALCVYAASDRRGAFGLKNSWGKGYPLVWMPYEVMARMLNEYGEATLQVDR